ncbi:hypothetical protein AMATHDRAFT_65799 [Amanita thiersii Skay4041]|uniref:Palmitoyltransferase n=1 Tax=Amanita thiersii Skay4041 TaxID=703135 RepID=A0A2A9NKS6_9AGAR|nr:hypothetical protein AMATHDRAFT_65799 [Amanita thiersii Skay4041]
MICARTVFRCFKAVERCADRVTGAAGPYFIALALVLISAGTVCFFDVISPSLPFPLLSVPICVLIATNMYSHYYWVCTTPPGFITDDQRDSPRLVRQRRWYCAKRKEGERRDSNVTPATVVKCRKCGGDKPERTHHCRICNRCVLKYDHHCPGINQCVGLYNERHFVLFMFYFVLSTGCYAFLGFPKALIALGLDFEPWPHLLPPTIFMLIYLLSVVLCFAVTIMLAFHLLGVANGETSVEAQDFAIYRKKAKEEGITFVNSYDLGKRTNLELFFNVGPHGEYSYWTLIFPFKLRPYTNGRAWARRPGLTRHLGIERADELTDDDGEDEAHIAP